MRDSSSGARVRRYIQGGMSTVRGYMHSVDAAAFAAILLHQRAKGLTGSVAEIGVYCGRSFFLMTQALAPGEAAFAADLFAEGPQPSGETRQLQEFRRNAARFDIDLHPNAVVAGPSERLKAPDIMGAVGPVRFFSIDGGHMLEHVRHDAALASAVLTEHGVLAFDDFCNPEWPETSLGVFDFLRDRQGEFAPFAITKAKLYVCRPDWHPQYLTIIKSSDWMRGYPQREISLLGAPLIWFHHRIADRVMFQALSRARLGSLATAIQARR